MEFPEQEAMDFYARFYRGAHHFPGKLKPFGEGFYMSHFGPLATFDGDDLTRLVLLAHSECVRVQIEPNGPQRLKIETWKRERTGDLYRRHPTIEQVLGSRTVLFHPGDAKILDDALDCLRAVDSGCDYIILLQDKFDQMMARLEELRDKAQEAEKVCSA